MYTTQTSHDATDRIFYFSSFCNHRLLAVILFVLLSGPSQRISSHLLTWLGFISFCVPSSRGHTCIFALKVFYIFIFLTVSVSLSSKRPLSSKCSSPFWLTKRCLSYFTMKYWHSVENTALASLASWKLRKETRGQQSEMFQFKTLLVQYFNCNRWMFCTDRNEDVGEIIIIITITETNV